MCEKYNGKKERNGNGKMRGPVPENDMCGSSNGKIMLQKKYLEW